MPSRDSTESDMYDEPFDFDRASEAYRRFSGAERRGAGRRSGADRRISERRVNVTGAAIERRSGIDRRAEERRSGQDRRSIEERRDSAWDALDGG
ncbi:MAG: hypothetical protein ACE5PT_06245 [Gemmatimonadales bacterium]